MVSESIMLLLTWAVGLFIITPILWSLGVVYAALSIVMIIMMAIGTFRWFVFHFQG